MDAKSRADELIAEAGARRAAGRSAEAIPLYREAALLFPPYASLELVGADSLHELGRLEEAAETYRRVVEAVPDHDQAWHRLALVLYQLGQVEDADRAMMRFHGLDAGSGAHTDADARVLIERYHRADSDAERAEIATALLHSSDRGVAELLHDFLVRSRRDPVGPDHDFAGLQASILVRFGLAEFVYWYSDGPAPDRDLIAADIDRYVAENPTPPPAERRQPIWASPPPAAVRRQRERAAQARRGAGRSGWWGRFRRRVGRAGPSG